MAEDLAKIAEQKAQEWWNANVVLHFPASYDPMSLRRAFAAGYMAAYQNRIRIEAIGSQRTEFTVSDVTMQEEG